MMLVSGYREEAQALIDEVKEKRRLEQEQKDRRHVWRRKAKPSLPISPEFQAHDHLTEKLGRLDWDQIVGVPQRPRS